MAALDACQQQQQQQQQPQVDQLGETTLPNDLVKCSTASKKQRERAEVKKTLPARLSIISWAPSRRSGTSAAAVISPAAEVSRRRSTSKPASHGLFDPSRSSHHRNDFNEDAASEDADADADADTNGRRAAGKETAVEGDEAPRRRRPPRALSSFSPLLPPSASDPPSALPPVTARRCPLPASQLRRVACRWPPEPVHRRIAPVRWLPDA
ncbi:hypothetical protein TESG_03686 [Trichophyton tonsurans CBS 112818]|uniref:Uncharacterized protein n=1 Tax=Trichophyton tonsurans (strain CBS 112818) TaxID=647933 RepID=F2RY78_TRIT1|nr:hypothetical protein TESG_03686 [Trichophyton tonsurans CBS 112818]